MFSFTHYILIYLTSTLIFFAIDMTWLGIVAKNFYRKHLGYLLSDTVVWPVAISFYLLFLIGLLIFAILPAIESRSILHALLYGALFGFFTYATYDLTNWSTIRDWPAIVSLVDILWGVILSGVVATLTYWVSVTYIIRS